MVYGNRRDVIVGVSADGHRWIGQGRVEIPGEDELWSYEYIYNSQIPHRAVRHITEDRLDFWEICKLSDPGAERPLSGNGPGDGKGYYLD